MFHGEPFVMFREGTLLAIQMEESALLQERRVAMHAPEEKKVLRMFPFRMLVFYLLSVIIATVASA